MPKADANSDLEQALGLLEKHLWSGQSLGGELEYVDRGPLSHAFGTRSEMPR